MKIVTVGLLHDAFTELEHVICVSETGGSDDFLTSPDGDPNSVGAVDPDLFHCRVVPDGLDDAQPQDLILAELVEEIIVQVADLVCYVLMGHEVLVRHLIDERHCGLPASFVFGICGMRPYRGGLSEYRSCVPAIV